MIVRQKSAAPPRRRSPFDIDDLSNKREVGSDPGTMWSLSSHKPGFGVRQLRDPDLEKLWQSDGLQPHTINVEFSKRTPVTHVSLWLNVKRDDSYTPTRIMIHAGTSWHNLNEVRYRDFNNREGEPVGWKHFYFSLPDYCRDEHDEEDMSDYLAEHNRREAASLAASRAEAERAGELHPDDPSHRSSAAENSGYIPGSFPPLKDEGGGTDAGAPPPPSKDEDPTAPPKLKPIDVWCLQIRILGNHQNGKDTHIRSCLIWGPPREGQDEAGAGAEAQKTQSGGVGFGVGGSRPRESTGEWYSAGAKSSLR